MDTYYQEDGITFLVEHLREPFDERKLLFKATVMEEYQEFTRQRNEDIRTSVNRYARVEARLRLVGMEPPASDYRAYKMLQAMKLPPQEYRQLTARLTDWTYDQVRDALLFMYPAKRYVPPVWDDRGKNSDPPAATGNAG